MMGCQRLQRLAGSPSGSCRAPPWSAAARPAPSGPAAPRPALRKGQAARRKPNEGLEDSERPSSTLAPACGRAQLLWAAAPNCCVRRASRGTSPRPDRAWHQAPNATVIGTRRRGSAEAVGSNLLHSSPTSSK